MRSAVFPFVILLGGLAAPTQAQPTFTLTTPDRPFVTQPLSSDRDGQSATVKVDPDHPLQVMEGFGGCFNELGWTALNTLPSAERDEVLRALFSPEGCNFSI